MSQLIKKVLALTDEAKELVLKDTRETAMEAIEKMRQAQNTLAKVSGIVKTEGSYWKALEIYQACFKLVNETSKDFGTDLINEKIRYFP